MSKVLDLWRGMTGTVLPFAGTDAPTGWLLCYGQAVSRTQYAALFAKIGTTYGAGDGRTTFNIPDLRGRVAAGKDNMGGTTANRLTSGGSGLNGAQLGSVGGTETHTLTEAQMPNHTHTGTAASAGAHTHTVSGDAGSAGAHTHTVSGSAASAGAHTHTVSGSAASAGAHTHTVSGSAASAGAHTHAVSLQQLNSAGADGWGKLATGGEYVEGTIPDIDTKSAGAHTHSVSGTAASSGAHTHTVSGTAASNGAHTHAIDATAESDGAHTHTINVTASSAGAHTHTVSISGAGSGNAHNNTQPTIILNHIIKT